jgi:hypothetical protein
MTAAEAMAFIEIHGIVLVSARGPVPSLTEAIAGEPIKGSWWGHAKGQQIFNILETVTSSSEILVCRLVNGKITLVHRRLWPALVRLAQQFSPDQIARVHQKHTANGRHVNTEIPYPAWVPSAVLEEAKTISKASAVAALGEWTTTLK